MSDTCLCPICGWTGTETDLEGDGACPACGADME
jgi:hypothetical protein